jgi:hypothetical protein
MGSIDPYDYTKNPANPRKLSLLPYPDFLEQIADINK